MSLKYLRIGVILIVPAEHQRDRSLKGRFPTLPAWSPQLAIEKWFISKKYGSKSSLITLFTNLSLWRTWVGSGPAAAASPGGYTTFLVANSHDCYYCPCWRGVGFSIDLEPWNRKVSDAALSGPPAMSTKLYQARDTVGEETHNTRFERMRGRCCPWKAKL